MESSQEKTQRGKRPLLSGFDKVMLFIVALILFYFLSSKIGYPVTTIEEKIEWVD